MSGRDTATLGPGSVLVGSLPAALMADQAPDRSTVEAVFTRRPERDEVVEIMGAEPVPFVSPSKSRDRVGAMAHGVRVDRAQINDWIDEGGRGRS